MENNHHERMIADFKKRFFISLFLTLPVLALIPEVRGFLGPIGQFFEFIPNTEFSVFLIATFIFLYGGYPFLKGLWLEIRKSEPGMMTLVGFALSMAYGYSLAIVFGLPGEPLFWELATLVDVMLLGHWVEMRSILGASRSLHKLAALMPSVAHMIVPGGATKDIPVASLTKDVQVLVKPGEKIPVDGIIEEGVTDVDESMLTGESKRTEKDVGEKVIGGSINGTGSITVRITKVGEETYLAQIIDLVEKAQASKSKTQRLADRAARWLTIIAVSGGIITFFAWFLFTGKEIGFVLERMIAVIVIACPHALGLAIPLVVSFSTALSAQRGILIRSRSAFEKARHIDTVIFDKTGTLTKGEFSVTDIVSLKEGYSNRQILSYAASLEKRSEHPIARAISAHGKELHEVKNFRAIPGKGTEGMVGEKPVKVVSLKYLNDEGFVIEHEKLERLKTEGKTIVFVVVDEIPVGIIGLDDTLRDESRDAIRRLREMGIRSLMITGDHQTVAWRVARELGVDEFFAEVRPEEKARTIREVQARGDIVAMVGDGINDAPALAQADIGIAIGAGTDVAIETADIVLVKNDPRDVVSVILLAQKTYGKMLQNLFWATGYNVFALPIAGGALFTFGIVLNPALGAVFMSLSTVIVAFNAVMLKFSKI